MRTARLLTVSQHALHSGVCTGQHARGRGRCVSQHALDRRQVCIPACTGQVGVSQYALGRGRCVSQYALGRGVCIPVCTGQGEVCISVCIGQGWCIPACTEAGGVCPGGMSAVVWPGGVSGQGVSSKWCLPGGRIIAGPGLRGSEGLGAELLRAVKMTANVHGVSSIVMA